MSSKTERVTVNLSPETKKRLEELAKRNRRSLADEGGLIIENELKK